LIVFLDFFVRPWFYVLFGITLFRFGFFLPFPPNASRRRCSGFHGRLFSGVFILGSSSWIDLIVFSAPRCVPFPPVGEEIRVVVFSFLCDLIDGCYPPRAESFLDWNERECAPFFFPLSWVFFVGPSEMEGKRWWTSQPS